MSWRSPLSVAVAERDLDVVVVAVVVVDRSSTYSARVVTAANIPPVSMQFVTCYICKRFVLLGSPLNRYCVCCFMNDFVVHV